MTTGDEGRWLLRPMQLGHLLRAREHEPKLPPRTKLWPILFLACRAVAYSYGLYTYDLYSHVLFSYGPIYLWPYVVMAYIVMAYIVKTLYSHGLYSEGPL